jgi:hypothetical protein
VFIFFIAIHNEGPDYIDEIVPHINNLILCRDSSYFPGIDAHVLAWRLKIAQEKCLKIVQIKHYAEYLECSLNKNKTGGK